MVSSPSLAPTGLSRAAAEQLAQQSGEPAWLRALRLAAYEHYERTPLTEQPTGNWRHTDLSGLNLEGVQPETAPAPAPRLDVPAASGLRVLSLFDAARDPELGERVREYLGHVVPATEDKLTALHYAFLDGGAVVYVPRNLAVEQPVRLTLDASTAARSLGNYHTLVIAEDGAEVSILDTLQGNPGLASGVVEIVAGRNAQVRYAQVQRWGDQTWSFSYQRARLAADAQLRILDAALGARQTRNTVQVYLDGNGSQADLLGLVYGDGRRHVDFQTLQEHVGNATRSDLVIHNALDGRSSSNFTGLIRITPESRGTESSQEQKNYLLSARAKADSDPRLEILNNDVVRCTHGAAVGPIDPELLFYLQSRGMDPETAQGIALEGFFRTVVGRLGHQALQADVWQPIQAKLGLGELAQDA